MSVAPARELHADTREITSPALMAGLWTFAAYHLGLAVVMAVAPHAFYKAVGPFGAYNAHYIRDVASFSAALGIGFVLAVRRPSWRVPVLGVTTAQFALHAVNHLLDIGKAHPAWTGYFDFGSLFVVTLLLARLLSLAVAESRARETNSPHPQKRSTP